MMTLIILVYTSPWYQNRYGHEIPVRTPVQTTDSLRTVTTRTPIPGVGAVPGAETIPPALSREKSLRDNRVDSRQKQDTPADTGDSWKQVNMPAEVHEAHLENDDIALVLSTRGGVIISATMNTFKGSTEEDHAQLVKQDQAWYHCFIQDGDSEIDVSDIIFTESRGTKTELDLTADLSENRQITRTYRIDETGFMLYVSTSLTGNWDTPTLHYSWHGPINKTEAKIRKLRIFPFSMFMRDDATMYDKVVYLGQGDRVTVDERGREKSKSFFTKEGIQKVEAGKSHEGSDFFQGDLDWYAVRNKYFTTIAIPGEKRLWSANASYIRLGDDKWYDFTISKRVTDGSTDLSLYIGPISFEHLKSYNDNLTEIMEFSWRFFRPLSIMFLWLIKKIHTVIPNWGLVLIAFSLTIKLVLYPLSHKSFVSMRKMSALQPQINELRGLHKNNPQKLQKATMALYKKEGVNPFSGCLPMLLQMPVFFALYPVVGRAFELRQAMFIPHWIEDLSRPDPFYILPVAMGISMFVQTKQTMKDPNQKAMLYVMPVVMVILFANFSAGLTLYWFLFNVMSYIQQTVHKPA